MPTRDVIALALAGPIDWEQFENLAYAILVSDDLPRLRKIGGVGDSGIDAVQDSFFDAERANPTIVQVTSQRAQELKAKRTIASLRENGIDCRHLILVFRHPISGTVRSSIIEDGAAEGVSIDLRDQEYLIAQLSKPGSPIFARFFSTAHEQLSMLLGQKDPLLVADTTLRHALMASLGAFVLQPRARLTRTTLFEKVVVAALVDAGGKATLKEIERRVSALLPGEQLSPDRISAAANALVKQGSGFWDDQYLITSESTIVELGQVAATSQQAYSDLISHVTQQCGATARLDDASRGYIERNVRRTLLSLIRAIGPLRSTDLLDADDPELTGHLLPIASADLPPGIGRTLLLSLAAYIEDPQNRTAIAPFIRSYAALAIWNLDPLGRSWQSANLSRSVVALDTDALLALLIEEIPEHLPLMKALTSLVAEGVRIEVSAHVFDEAATHISRADRTFHRFSGSLLRMPPSSVDSEVWHAVVRGYYYSILAGATHAPYAYWSKYFDRANPRAYVEYLLSRRLNCSIAPLDEIPSGWQADLETLSVAALERRERSRYKAEFREDDEMADRIRADVAMALHLAARARDAAGAAARGYLASEDRAFTLIQGHSAWRDRPRVHIRTRALPQLVDFISPSLLTDDEFIGLLFHPMFTTAADQLKDDIERLAGLGVDLRSVPLDRLEWELSKGLHKSVLDMANAARETEEEPTEREIDATLAVLEGAQNAGYKMEPVVEELATRYRETQSDADNERRRRLKAEENIRELAIAARGTTKKGRRRVNKILRELGIELELPDAETD